MTATGSLLGIGIIATVNSIFKDELVAFPITAFINMSCMSLAVVNCVAVTGFCKGQPAVKSSSTNELSFFKRYMKSCCENSYLLLFHRLRLVLSVKEAALAIGMYVFSASAVQITTVKTG